MGASTASRCSLSAASVGWQSQHGASRLLLPIRQFLGSDDGPGIRADGADSRAHYGPDACTDGADSRVVDGPDECTDGAHIRADVGADVSGGYTGFGSAD